MLKTVLGRPGVATQEECLRRPRNRLVRILGLLCLYVSFSVAFLRDFEGPREIFFWLELTYDAHLVVRSMIMITFALWMVGLLVVMFLSRNRVIRFGTVLLLAFTATLHWGYKYHVNGLGFTLHDAGIMVTGTEAAGDAIVTYGALFLKLLVLVSTVLVVVCLVGTRWIGVIRARWSLLLVPTLLLGAVFVWHSSGRHCFFPIPFRVPGLLSAHTIWGYYGPRQPVRILPCEKARVPAVVFVIDESIMADHLSINGYARDTSPYLKSISDELANFGVASSAGNASFSSISVLFSGIRMDQIPDNSFNYRRFPCLAQYAVAAGFKTYIIRGQYYEDVFYNVKQACTSDMFVVLNAVTPAEDVSTYGDRYAADRIIECVRKEEKVLIFTQKWGAHFPYERRYPPDKKVFRPTIDGYGWSEDLERSVNSYDNAVLWTCDGYFEYLLSRLKTLNKDILVIYTSDHGQVIPGTVKGLCETMAFTDNYPSSACVPLFVWGTGERASEIVRQLRDNRSAYNASSHFNVFPTILNLLGYKRDSVVKEYGDTLFEPVSPLHKRYYIAGLNGCPSARVYEFRCP